MSIGVRGICLWHYWKSCIDLHCPLVSLVFCCSYLALVGSIIFDFYVGDLQAVLSCSKDVKSCTNSDVIPLPYILE